MKKIVVLLIGIGLGAVLAHQISRTPAGQRIFGQINATLDDFNQGVREGYREREAELRAAIGGSRDLTSDSLKD